MFRSLQHRIRDDVTVVVELMTGGTALMWGLYAATHCLFCPPSGQFHQLHAEIWHQSSEAYGLTFVLVALAQFAGIVLRRRPLRKFAAKCAALLWGIAIANYAYSGTLGGAALTLTNFLGEAFVLLWWTLEDAQDVG